MADSHPANARSDMNIVDFDGAILRLHQRARNARRRILIVGLILLVGVVTVAGISVSEAISRSRDNMMPIISSMVTAQFATPEAELTKKIKLLIEQQIGPTTPTDSKFVPLPRSDYDYLTQEIDRTINQLDRVQHSAAETRVNQNDIERWEPIVNSFLIGAGAISFGILFIQIALNFMRYYARLAELYDAQADALLASRGDADKAYVLLQQFSPNAIEMGKTPTTLYEKALEAITEVAKSKWRE